MANKEHLRKVLFDAIPVLCRNGLPPSVTFRIEAMIGITIVDDFGHDSTGEGNVTILSFQQTVSDNGVSTSQFGSNNPPDDVTTASHKPNPHLATVSVKQEYSVKTKCGAPSHAIGRPPTATDTYGEDYGNEDGGEFRADEGTEGDYVGDEDEYYDDEAALYYDDGSSYPPGVKLEASDDTYMEAADESEYYTQAGEYGSGDYAAQPSARQLPKSKAAMPRPSQLGPGRVRKSTGTARGASRPRTSGTMSQVHATSVAVRQIGSVTQAFICTQILLYIHKFVFDWANWL